MGERGPAHAAGVQDCWYFAYGSNLLRDQKEERTGPIREARVVHLPDYRLVFNKPAFNQPGVVYANITPAPGSAVWGVAYRCDETAMQEMDGWEGGYRRETVQVIDQTGTPLEAIAYIAKRPLPEEGTPTTAYLNRILDGAENFALPAAYIETLRNRKAQP